MTGHESDAGRARPKARRIHFTRSMRGKLMLAIAVVVGVTAVALTATNYFYVRSTLRQSVQEQLKLRADGLTRVLTAHVGQQRERVMLVASRTRLRQLLREYLDGDIQSQVFRDQTRRILLDAQRSTSGFLSVEIATPDGIIVTATDESHLGKDVSTTRAFENGLLESTVGVPEAVNGGYQSALSAPARSNDGRMLGVVLVQLNAEPLRQLLNAIPSGFKTAEVRVGVQQDDSVRYLFPRGGTTRSADEAITLALAGESGVGEMRDPLGRDVLAAYQPVGYRGWALVSQVEAREAYAPIGRLRLVFLGAGVLFLIIAGIVSVRLANDFTRPILSLASVASTVAQGDLSARADESSDDEAGVMGRAFNAMTRNLERHQSELEELVSERTKEVEQRSHDLERSRDQLVELCRLLEEQAVVMERDLQRAEVIQRSLLPTSPPMLGEFSVQTLYRPGRNVGGDLYDVLEIGDRFIALVVADASGHGVSAAMLSVLFKHRLRIVDVDSGQPLPPGEALGRLNRALSDDLPAPGVFVTCVYCLIDTATREMVVASAGHPPVICIRAAGDVETVEHTGPALGLRDHAEFEETRLKFRDGDRVLLYTDGLFDIGTATDVESIADAVRRLGRGERVLEDLLIKVTGGFEREDRDDVTLVLFDATPGASRFCGATTSLALQPHKPPERAQLSFAETESETYICCAGRVTWTHGETLLEAADSVFDTGRNVVFELSECEYLDSTMLGTLHELVQRACAAGVGVRIEGARRTIVDSFKELSMKLVLEHLGEGSDPPPTDRTPLKLAETDAHRQKIRLMRAHKMLANLSDDKREEFERVVEAVRSELPRWRADGIR